MSIITMPSGTTKERATFCCSLGRGIGSARDHPCSAASDWAGSCATTIEKRRDGPTADQFLWPYDFLAATFREKPLAHWMQWLAMLDICYGPVNTLPEAIADPNLLQRGAIVTAKDGRQHIAPVVRFRDEPSRPLYREPLLGEHTEEVLGDVGCDRSTPRAPAAG